MTLAALADPRNKLPRTYPSPSTTDAQQKAIYRILVAALRRLLDDDDLSGSSAQSSQALPFRLFHGLISLGIHTRECNREAIITTERFADGLPTADDWEPAIYTEWNILSLTGVLPTRP